MSLLDLERDFNQDLEGYTAPAWMLGEDWRDQARYGVAGTPFQHATDLSSVRNAGNLAGRLMYDRETDSTYPTVSNDKIAGALSSTIPGGPEKPPIDNSLTIKDYAALASAAGILGAMFMPKPKAPHPTGGRTYQGGGGNTFLRRHV